MYLGDIMRAIMEVDICKFNNNIKKIKKIIGNKTMMPIIKANGYGTYINKNIDVLDNFDIVGVAVVDEGIELRNLGYKKDIFLLNEPSIDEIENIIKYNITIGVCDKLILNRMIENKSKIKVHLEIETGMNRTGIKIENLEDILKLLKGTNIEVEGIYTHLSSADKDVEYTNKQLSLFKEAVELTQKYYKLKYIHSSASSGLLNYDDGVSNMVRPGIIIYGYKPYKDANIDVEPICKLKAKIVFIKEVNENESISYSRTFITNKKMKIATIQIGYADGIRRELSNKGRVIINGKLCNIVGNICMDSFMVDVTDIDVKVGDYAYIWDNDLIKLDDIANMCNTINYEIMTCISYRVPRIFID